MKSREGACLMRAEVSIEDPEFYIKQAFLNARKALSQKEKKRKKSKSGFFSAKRRYADRITLFQQFFKERFSEIIGAFPELWRLSPFYRELTNITFGVDEFKNALGSLSWTISKINGLSSQYRIKILSADNLEEARNLMREYEGRISSLLRELGPALNFLRTAKEEIRNYPIVRQDTFTVAIAGFPNVGKSTLLSKLTKSRPKIAPYPFTTKSLLLGYASAFDFASSDIQIIDTPGTLDRPEKMNSIEKQAYSAMRNLANLIVYVFDPTLQYPLQLQEQLLSKITTFGKPVIIYISKTDIQSEEVVRTVEEIKNKHNSFTNSEELASELRRIAREYYAKLKAQKFGNKNKGSN
ncbi:MAG: GTPase [Candidatus Woesearchaeota archaeon]